MVRPNAWACRWSFSKQKLANNNKRPKTTKKNSWLFHLLKPQSHIYL